MAAATIAHPRRLLHRHNSQREPLKGRPRQAGVVRDQRLLPLLLLRHLPQLQLLRLRLLHRQARVACPSLDLAPGAETRSETIAAAASAPMAEADTTTTASAIRVAAAEGTHPGAAISVPVAQEEAQSEIGGEERGGLGLETKHENQILARSITHTSQFNMHTHTHTPLNFF